MSVPSTALFAGLRVLVACEFSGTVRDAFRAHGADAMSCDLLPTEAEGPHYRGDVRDLLTPGRWDLMIAHPPCTHLAVSGARWFKDKVQEQAAALDFVRLLLDAPVPHIALENPVLIMIKRERKKRRMTQESIAEKVGVSPPINISQTHTLDRYFP